MECIKPGLMMSDGRYKKLIETDRVEIEHTSVSSLPYSDNMFNLVSGFETYYFWPDLINDLKEIYHVLKPVGTLVLINEMYRKEDKNWIAIKGKKPDA